MIQTYKAPRSKGPVLSRSTAWLHDCRFVRDVRHQDTEPVPRRVVASLLPVGRPASASTSSPQTQPARPLAAWSGPGTHLRRQRGCCDAGRRAHRHRRLQGRWGARQCGWRLRPFLRSYTSSGGLNPRADFNLASLQQTAWSCSRSEDIDDQEQAPRRGRFTFASLPIQDERRCPAGQSAAPQRQSALRVDRPATRQAADLMEGLHRLVRPGAPDRCCCTVCELEPREQRLAPGTRIVRDASLGGLPNRSCAHALMRSGAHCREHADDLLTKKLTCHAAALPVHEGEYVSTEAAIADLPVGQ